MQTSCTLYIIMEHNAPMSLVLILAAAKCCNIAPIKRIKGDITHDNNQ